MKADSSAGKKVVFNGDFWRKNKLNMPGSSSTLYYDVWCWPKCWLNVGQPPAMPAQHWTNTGSMSPICRVIPLIDQCSYEYESVYLL